MITMKNLQVEDIKDEWLYNALTQGIKECITAPVLTLDPTKPEPIKRAEMILENFSQEDSPVVATVIAPGNFIQMILPKHEILLSVMFIYKERNTYVQLIIQKLAYERLDEYSSGIQELVEVKPITENDQDVREIRNGLLTSLKSQELSEILATKLKQAIHEVFENEKKKGGLMDKEPSLEPMESSIIREALYLLTPQLP